MVLGGPTAGAWVALPRDPRAPRAGVPALVRHARQPLGHRVRRGRRRPDGARRPRRARVRRRRPGRRRRPRHRGRHPRARRDGQRRWPRARSSCASGSRRWRWSTSSSGRSARVTLAEIGLASVFTVAYVAVGWWAPARAGRRRAARLARRGVRGHRPADEAAPRTRQFQRELESTVARHATRHRSRRPAADARPRRLRPDQQGLRHARRRRGPRRDRRAAAGAGADDGPRRPARRRRVRDVLPGCDRRGGRPAARGGASRRRSGVRSRPSVGARARRRLDRRACSSGRRPSIPSAATLHGTGPIATMQDPEEGPEGRALAEGREVPPVRRVAIRVGHAIRRPPDVVAVPLPRGRSDVLELARSSPPAPCSSRPRSCWGSGSCADDRAG